MGVGDFTDKVKHAGEEAVAKAKTGIGKITGNESLEAEGRAEDAAVDVKQAADKAVSDARDGADNVRDRLDDARDDAADKLDDARDRLRD